MASRANRIIAILDYGTGNVASLRQAFSSIGVRAHLVSSSAQISAADALVLPGVGHFGSASVHLQRSGLWESLRKMIHDGLPTLGICLGFQLLTRASEEAPGCVGLGLLPLTTERLIPSNTKRYKVPHIGWNTIECDDNPPYLLSGIPPDKRLFYFANGYAIPPSLKYRGPQKAFYFHGSKWMALAQKDSVHGVQFHPEKSREQGLQLLRNFVAI